MPRYPVTQYLIECYYELSMGSTPAGPHLKDHWSSNKLFDIINRGGIAEHLQDLPEDNEQSNTFHEINLPSTYLAFRIVNHIRRFFNWWLLTNNQSLLYWDLQFERSQAISYDQWAHCSKRMDHILQLDDWKLQDSPTNSKIQPMYDAKLLQLLTRQMKSLRESNNCAQLLYLIRTTWMRNVGNITNVNLYTHCNIGTKKTIEDYIAESQNCIDCLLQQDTIDKSYLLSILRQTKRNIGKTALVLSGGATFGLFHIGVLAVLFEADLIPKVISGTSAGAIVASIFCVHTKSEIPNLLANVLNMEFNIFKDDNDKSNSEDILMKLSRFLKGGHWFENKHLKNTMIEFLGDLTFREAYYRTGKILNITVSPASNFKQQSLLNNLTAPNVLIWSAVCASCSVPGIFPATPLFEKDPKTGATNVWLGGHLTAKFVDGSVDNDLPITRLSEMFNIDHIIACQVNPHVFPLLKNSLSCVGGQLQNEFISRLRTKMTYCYNTINNEILHYLDILSELGVAPNVMNKFSSILSQRYSGNITILPDLSMLTQSHELMRNPSREFLLLETMLGARATWPKLSMIRTTCGQEFMLDHAISTLRTELLMSSDLKSSLSFTGDKYDLIKLTPDVIDQNIVNSEIDNDTTNKQLLDENIMETETVDPLQMFVADNNNNNVLSGRLRSYSVRSNSINPLTTSTNEKYNSSILQPTTPAKYRKRSETTSALRSPFDNTTLSPKSRLPISPISPIRQPTQVQSSERHVNSIQPSLIFKPPKIESTTKTINTASTQTNTNIFPNEMHNKPSNNKKGKKRREKNN